MNIQWFPGHMAKTRRLIEENLKLVDIVAELIDARLPKSSRNPQIDEIVGAKPRIILLNKSDTADEKITAKWVEHFKKEQIDALPICSISGNLNTVYALCKKVAAPMLARQKERGIVKRSLKIMVVGIPNVGKSSFINKLAGRKSAITGDRPGVTRGKQWIKLAGEFELLDTPGILWPKFEDEQIGLKLAFTGAVKDEILDVELLAAKLLETLAQKYPASLLNRYKMENLTGLNGHEMPEILGKKRGFIVSGGEIDTFRAANILLDEFRAGKLGRISLESPEEFEG